MACIDLTDREIAQIIASLRNWQIDSLNEDLDEAFAGHLEDHAPMSDEEIDALCERLNFAGDAPVVTGAAY